MPKPLVQEHRYDFRGGRNTAISSDLLNPNELVDCTNARISEVYGGFTKRSGSQRIHQTAFPAKIDGVFQWDAPSGVKQTVVISNGALYFRNGSDYTLPFNKITPTITQFTTNTYAGGTAGWTDPDGVDDGINSTSSGVLTSGQDLFNTVAAGSRLLNKVGNAADGVNLPAGDNKFTLQGFQITADATGLRHLAGDIGSVVATVIIEFSTNSGGSYSPLPGTIQAIANIGTKVTTIVAPFSVVCGSAAANVWIRLKLTTETTWTSGGVGGNSVGSGVGSVQIFNTLYKTDNYPITWNQTGSLLSTQFPATFATFRANIANAPLTLYIGSGGHYWSWDGVATLTQLDGVNNAPGAVGIIAYHTRMFIMQGAAPASGLLPKTIFWSRIGDATFFTTGTKTDGGSAVTDFLTGQQLIALEVIGSSLLMSTTDSVMRFTGHASDDIVISQDTEGISAEVGAVGLQALKRYENVAAMFTDRGPYVVTETYAQPSGEQLNTDWNKLDKVNISKTMVEYNRERKELLFAVPGATDGGTPKTIFSQAVRLQTWQGPWIYPFAMTYLCKFFDGNNIPNVLAGCSDGFVRILDVGDLDDMLFDGSGGVAISMSVEIPVLHFGLPGVKKALNRMLLQASLPIGSNLSVNVAFDGGALIPFPVVASDSGEENYRVDISGDGSQGFRARIQFTESSTQPITVNGFTILAWNMLRST